MDLPCWMIPIKMEWDMKIAESKLKFEHIECRERMRLKEIWESEHSNVYCYACDRPLPCEDHDLLSEYVQF